MKVVRRQINLVVAIRQFRNVNLISKGCYKFRLQALSSDKLIALSYHANQNAQLDRSQLTRSESTKVQYNSDSQRTRPSSTTLNMETAQESTNCLYTLPFVVKYHCQHIKLKSISLFTEITDDQFITVRLTLCKMLNKNTSFSRFQPLQSMQFVVNCNNHFLQQKQILMPHPECCSLKIILLNSIVNSYQQIYDHCAHTLKTTKLEKNSDKNQIFMAQIRKIVKKQRYQTFILKKELNNTMKNVKKDLIKLPLHFIQKQKMSMNEVQTNQMLFFKYLAFYQRYQITSQMLKQEMQHINFDKINIIKDFIDAFQNQGLNFCVLQQKQKVLMERKYRHYIIQNSNTFPMQIILDNYSQQQLKSKKQKIKQLDKCIYALNSPNQNVSQSCFMIQKQNKKNPIERFRTTYPIIFRDILYLQKQKPLSNQIVVSTLVHKKIKSKKKYFIFAHGFQGLPIDLSYLINMIRYSNQKVKIIVLKSYKNNMGVSIEVMAKKVANEINGIFQKVDLKQIQPQIVFIGHSMGSIILRASFKQMFGIFEYFDTFISICSPHLGYIQGTKFLTQAGLSILCRFKPIQSLNQLSNRDDANLEKTFMYRLSKEGSLCHFRSITLIASIQDDYVPWHSARIQPFSKQSSKQRIQRDMISNIFGIGSNQSKIERIQRIQITFPNQKLKTFNSFIGRTSHIKPLNDRGFLQILVRQILLN